MQREYTKNQAAICLERLAGCAGTAERDYTIERKPTLRSKSGSSLPPTTSILELMAAGSRKQSARV